MSGFLLLKPVALVGYPPAQNKNRDGTDDAPNKGEGYISHQPEHDESDPEYLALHDYFHAWLE